jgi:hypothetical protein
MDKVMKAEIEKILEDLHDTILFSYQNIKDDKLYQKDAKVRLSHYSSSLTTLIIKWLESKRKEVILDPTNYLQTPEPEARLIIGRNQLITELIGEINDNK